MDAVVMNAHRRPDEVAMTALRKAIAVAAVCCTRSACVMW